MFSPEQAFNDWHLTGFKSAKAYLFETIDSTHKFMKEKARAGEIEPGTLIVADAQSDGHGRHDRTWDSPAHKNLYFNILIPLEGIPANHFAQITQIAALTFAEVFNHIQEIAAPISKEQTISASQNICDATIKRITVKWPNDILYGKSKFCGILAEIIFMPGAKPALSMGVGINVNSDPEIYAHLNRNVTTLKAITNKTINRKKLLQMLIGNLERAIGQFRAFGITPWIEAWREMDQFIGCRGTIVVNNHCTDDNRNSGEGAIKKTGHILDMQPDGSLLFQCDDGKIETVISADLEI